MRASVGRLQWAVKQSFVDYIKSLADGTIETFGGCTVVNGAFSFPGEPTGDRGVSFMGGVHFRGFAGMLDVCLVNPLIEGDVSDQRLTALVEPGSSAARVTIATIEGAGPIRPGEPWTAIPKLSSEGARMFGYAYYIGTELAPVMFDPGS